MDKVRQFFGASDLDFESARLSRAYSVRSTDEAWAPDEPAAVQRRPRGGRMPPRWDS
jgi:hypothetical protein